MLCRMAGFKPGLIFLYENLRLFREVLQVGKCCFLPPACKENWWADAWQARVNCQLHHFTLCGCA